MFEKNPKSIMAGNLNSFLSYIITTVQAVLHTLFHKEMSLNWRFCESNFYLIYITVPKRWCQCLGLFHRPKNSVRCHQFYNAQPLCRFIVPYQISCSKRVWHGWIWSIPLSSPNPKGPSMFLLKIFKNQIYRSETPVLFMVLNFYQSNLPVPFLVPYFSCRIFF